MSCADPLAVGVNYTGSKNPWAGLMGILGRLGLLAMTGEQRSTKTHSQTISLLLTVPSTTQQQLSKLGIAWHRIAETTKVIERHGYQAYLVGLDATEQGTGQNLLL